MPIDRLRIGRFRNITSAELEFGRVNVLAGPNGSGKTSILEAIHVLSAGRSFRTTRPEPLIQRDAQRFTLHAAATTGLAPPVGVSIGVLRDREGGFEARIQGRNIQNTAELARTLPVLLINADSFELLDGGPRNRRQFLDWGVFHVEHGFHAVWLDVQRVLAQRNALLRHARIAGAQLDVWDARLAEAATRLDTLRRDYFEAFYPRFQAAVHDLGEVPEVELGYYRGWDRERELGEVLAEQRAKDIERGFTGTGPHRADIRVRSSGLAAADVLSRGQQKLVVCAMKLAQGALFSVLRDQDLIILIDDLPAELDVRHRIELCRLLGGLRCQILVSCVDARDLDGCWDHWADGPPKVFHVEHGRATRCDPGKPC
jgi:DNA replication and repair protein RecF